MSRPTPAVDIARHEAAAKLLPVARLIIGGRRPLAGSGGVHHHVNPATGLVQATCRSAAHPRSTRLSRPHARLMTRPGGR